MNSKASQNSVNKIFCSLLLFQKDAKDQAYKDTE